MRVLGIILIVLGIVGLLSGGFAWTQKDKVVDLGPVEVTRDQHRQLPIAPVIAVGLVIAGVGALAASRRQA